MSTKPSPMPEYHVYPPRPYEATHCAGCGKRISRPAPALPYSYCRTCRGR